MKKYTVYLLIMLFAMMSMVFGEEKTEEAKPTYTFGLVSYLHYVYDLDTISDYNAFEMTRGYLDFKVNFNNDIKFRITPDFTRKSGGPLNAVIKFAYVEFNNIFGLKDTNLRFGMNPTAWEGYMNDWWGYRWIDKTPSGTHNLTKSSDLGVSLLGNLLDKAISYQISVSNGEGFSGNQERDSAKTFEATIEIAPVKDLPIHFFAHARQSKTISDEESKDNLLAGAVYYKDATLQLGAEYMENQYVEYNSSLLSIISSLKMGNMTILGRIDIFNPIDLAEEDVEKFIIAGIGYSFSKNVQAMIDVRYNTSQNPEILDDTKVYLNWEIKY